MIDLRTEKEILKDSNQEEIKNRKDYYQNII